MMHRFALAATAATALTLAACSGEPAADPAADSVAVSPDDAANPAAGQGPATPAETEMTVPPITAAGFGPHRVGQPLHEGGAAPVTEPQVYDGGDCRLFRDPGLPDSWIMTDGKKVVQVFTVLGTSTLRTSEGIGLGDSIDKLKAAYPDLRFQGSDHAAPPAGSYYTAGPNEPGLRFATDGSKVVEISAGRQPWLGAAEGCA